MSLVAPARMTSSSASSRVKEISLAITFASASLLKVTTTSYFNAPVGVIVVTPPVAVAAVPFTVIVCCLKACGTGVTRNSPARGPNTSTTAIKVLYPLVGVDAYLNPLVPVAFGGDPLGAAPYVPVWNSLSVVRFHVCHVTLSPAHEMPRSLIPIFSAPSTLNTYIADALIQNSLISGRLVA